MELFCGIEHVLFCPEENSAVMGDAALNKMGRKRPTTGLGV